MQKEFIGSRAGFIWHSDLVGLGPQWKIFIPSIILRRKAFRQVRSGSGQIWKRFPWFLISRSFFFVIVLFLKNRNGSNRSISFRSLRSFLTMGRKTDSIALIFAYFFKNNLLYDVWLILLLLKLTTWIIKCRSLQQRLLSLILFSGKCFSFILPINLIKFAAFKY